MGCEKGEALWVSFQQSSLDLRAQLKESQSQVWLVAPVLPSASKVPGVAQVLRKYLNEWTVNIWKDEWMSEWDVRTVCPSGREWNSGEDELNLR